MTSQSSLDRDPLMAPVKRMTKGAQSKPAKKTGVMGTPKKKTPARKATTRKPTAKRKATKKTKK